MIGSIFSLYILFTLALANTSRQLYVAYLIIMAIAFAYILLKGKISKFNKSNDWIPFIFILIWAYGFFLGFLNGNNTYFVVSCFAGMITYTVYYILIIFKMHKEKLFRIIVFSSFIVLLITLSSAILFYLLDIDIYHDPTVQLFFGEFRGGASTGQIRIFQLKQVMIFVLWSLALLKVFGGKRLSRSHIEKGWKDRLFNFTYTRLTFFLLLLTSFALIFIPVSKGYFLALLVITCIYLYATLIEIFKHFLVVKLVLLLLFFCIAFFTLNYFNYLNIAEAIFDVQDPGNINRVEQFSYLIQDMTFLGKGLGAVVSGSIRNESRPYGFELVYVNIFHKFGIFAIIILLAYFKTFYDVVKKMIYRQVDWRYSATALGLMSFLFPAMGNPILFSPQIVLMHCLALFLIRDENKSNEKHNRNVL